MALSLIVPSSSVASGKSMKPKGFLPPGLGTGVLLPSWNYIFSELRLGGIDGKRGRRRQVMLGCHRLLSFLQMNSTE